MDRQPPRGDAGRRGVSIGVIAALVTVVVVVGAVILWRFFGDALSSRSDAAAARCVDGEVAVAVVADPSIADQVAALAEKYNETAAPGRRPLRQGRRQARRLRPGRQRIRRRLARRTRRAAGAVDPGQLGVRGPTGGGRGRTDRQRQPLTGDLAGAARSSPAAQRRSWPTELGHTAGSADESDRRWTGWTCPAGARCGWRCRSAATATRPIWRPRRSRPRRRRRVRRRAPGSAR